MSGGSPAPTAAVSFEDKAPQGTDSISTRTPGCVRSISAPISFKTATALGSTAVCQMRSVVCCGCLGVQDKPITTDRARRKTKHRAITALGWFCISYPTFLDCALRKGHLEKDNADSIHGTPTHQSQVEVGSRLHIDDSFEESRLSSFFGMDARAINRIIYYDRIFAQFRLSV